MSRHDERPGEHIIPDGFVGQFDDADSVNEALEIMESRPSSTPIDEQDRCPDCDSVRLVFLPHTGEHEQKTDEAKYECQACGARIDNPADPHPDWSDMAFEWVDEPADPDERGEMVLFAPLSERERAALAIRLYKPWSDAGPSYRDLAPLFPHGHCWIGRRVRWWKEGDYRDLVPEPGPSVDASSSAGAVATDGGRRRWEHYGA